MLVGLSSVTLFITCTIGSTAQSSPQSDQSEYTITVNQNALTNSVLLTVHCSYSGSVRYMIDAYSPNSPFLTIDSDSGAISLTTNSINLVLQNISVFLSCFDPADSSLRDLITLVVSRVDENEFPPQFTHMDLQVSISESCDFTVDPYVTDVNATDSDTGMFGSITYGVEGTIPDPFRISSSSGEITLQSSLDFETIDQYVIIVTASNPPIPATGVVRSAELLVTVIVIDVNDAPPRFTEPNASYQHSVNETFLPEFPRPAPGFLTIRCSDPDSNVGDITYAISPDSNPAPFILNTATGNVSVTQDLDYETQTSYSFTVMCFDNGSPNLTASALVDIIVNSVNEYPPVVVKRPGTIVISESTAVNTLVASADPDAPLSERYKYSASDQDAGPDGNVTYTLPDDPDARFFMVDLITGNVTLREVIDVDTRITGGSFEQLLFSITVCDRVPPVEECPNFEMRVLVFTVNEFQPKFSQQNYTVSFPESTLPGTTVVVATCTDGDVGNGAFSGIDFVASQDTFSIDIGTGAVITTTTLDYETAQSYGFELRCTDTGGNEDRAVVRVEVIAENDNQPQFDPSSYEFPVSRTTPTNRYFIGSVVARDADIGPGGILQFTIDANGYFDITGDGNIELFSSVLSYSDSNISFNVHVSDGSNTDTAAVVIQLTAGNLNRPQFVLGSRAVEVSELSPVGTSIISILCNDTDNGTNGEIRLSINPESTENRFQIDPITGEVSVSSILILPLNTSIQEHLLEIRCEDRGIPVLADEAVIFIRVFQDDSSLLEIQNRTISTSVSEDANINDFVVTIEATGLDSGRLIFRLEDQSVPGVFIIDPPSGCVSVAAALDREQTSMYQMTVVVTEVRNTPGPERSDNATLIIYVRDVNDNSPTCDTTMLSVTIPETLAINSSFLHLICSDLDDDENGRINYNLSSNSGLLSISNRGDITLVGHLNATERNTLLLTVTVSDQGIPSRTNHYQVTIFVFSTNRFAPSFVNLPTTLEVSEAQLIQQVIFVAEATDPDRGSFGQVSYDIVNHQEYDPFSIFANTGGLFLTRKLNFFEQQLYKVNISASDGNFTVIELLNISVLDANEFAPQCQSLLLTTTIPESISPNQTLTQQLLCSDSDEGSNGVITFRIASGNVENAFEISTSGSLRTLLTLNFEIFNQYILTIEISDSGNPPLSLNATYVVVVEPVNEFSPTFELSLYNASIPENIAVGTSVLQVLAIDGDRSAHPDGQVTYSILGLNQPVFSISEFGLLQVSGVLDREQTDNYRFTVRASDGGQPVNMNTTTIEIAITDVDDNPPQFAESFYVAALNHTYMENGTFPVTTVDCTDRDLSTNAAVTYSIDEAADHSQFFEILSSGLIQMRGDLPISKIYTFTVVCKGPAPANFSDTAVVSIEAFVDSNITFYPSNSYNASIPENTIPVYAILTVNASALSGSSLIYTLLNGGSTFSIDERTGSLRLISSLDYETTQSYALRVQASDSGSPPNIGETLVQILVENVNDETPQITTAPSTIDLPEGPTTLSSTDGQYQCTDADYGTFGQVGFRLVSGNMEGAFSLSEDGTLQLVGNLDYEITQSYTLVAVCEDGGDPPRTDSITILITISPINDNAPQFASESIDISVSEAVLLNSVVGAPIQAADADLPPHNSLRYSIVSGDSNPQTFIISSTTGQLTLVRTLDFETTPSFTLLIEAQDSGGQIAPDFPVLNDTIRVNVIVLDYNDNQPQLSQQTYTGTVQEGAPVGGQVSLSGTISCSDLDSGRNSDTSLHVTSGNTNNAFSIQNTGIITVAASLDFEVQRSYILTVECRDNGLPQLASRANVVISLMNVNEFGPVFNQSLYTFQIPENSSIGSVVAMILAVDRDAGAFGTISYSFNASGAPFTLDTISGVITLSGSLDYETQQRLYLFEAQATDDSGLDGVTTVVITLSNSDDNTPRFTMSNYFASVSENATAGVSVGQVSCSDADDQADGIPIRYGFSNSGVPFQIEERLGTISVFGALDLERTPKYTLAITCTDSGGNSATAFTTINLDPVNDFPPVFTGTPYTLELTENTMIGSSVFRLMATDDDVMRYNDITFSFTSGNEQGRFSIDPSTGVISVSQTIDRESQPQYELGVLAQNVILPDDTSGSHPLSDSTMLTIVILDVNDNDPVLMPGRSLIVSVLESNSSNTVLAEFNCYDQDLGDNGTTSFSIVSESTLSSGSSALTPFSSGSGDIAPDSSFEILSNGTLITTDYIYSSTHLDVVCTDHGTPQRTSTTTITVHVVTTNDHAPHFLQASYHISVREDQMIGTDIRCFTAIDMDSSLSRGGIIEYSLLLQPLSGQDANRFSIRGNTGCIFALLPLDYDSQSSYQYTIIATDSGQPPLNGTATLIISVIDVIRDSPQFVGAPYTRSISEGVESGTLVAHTFCIEPDQNDSVSSLIESGNNGSIFSIDSENGDIVISPGFRLDYETTQTYTLGVVCSDSYNLSDSALVFITVSPVNEFTPTFGARAVEIPEHSINGASVTQLVWNDGDLGPDGEVTFTITSGNTNNAFFITSDGRILVSGVLDREVISLYSLQIRIKDLPNNPSEQRSSENHVNITITDINDHTPVFDSNQYTFDSLDGSELQGYYIGMVHCTDDDIGSNAVVTYQIVSNFTGTTLVSVDGQSGHLTTRGDLETRELDTIFFLVQCVDGGSNPLSSTARVIVLVDEINRHAPEFANSSYYVLVPEDTQIIHDIIVTVHAADGDRGVNGQVRYHLQDDFDHQFFVSEDSGELSLLKPLDFETRIEYLLTVEATDSAEDSLTRMTSDVNITIEVTGVNEYTPMCPHTVYHTFINRTTSGELINLSCTDGDSGPDGGLNYSITGGNEERLFLLDTDGGVIVPAPVIPDIDTENYTLEVNVSDSGIPPRQTQVKVIITYSFENLASPVFNESVYNLSVSELAQVGHIVAIFEATDTDRGLQGEVTYSLNGTKSFNIDPASGQLFIARPLDWETSISEVFTIIVQDDDPFSPRSGSAMVNIEVQNENDNSPQCDQVFYALEILSTAQPGDTLLTLSCSDPDGDTLTYQLVAGRNRRQASSFAIERRSGHIYVTGPLTHSTTTMLRVLVSDGGGYTAGVTVSVQIRFANVEPPVFSNPQYTFDVLEDTALLSVIGSIFATDNDSNSIDLSYSTQDSAQTSFYVNPATGEIVLTVPLDYEIQQQYSFIVRVEDGGSYNGSKKLSDMASVVVNVLNTNDNLPQLENGGIYGATLSENTSVNTSILNISCTDGDAAPYGTPTILNTGFSGTPFELVGVGEKYTLRVSETLRLPDTGSYTINITCSDGGGLSTNGQVFIFVSETEAPVFSEPVYEWTLRESAPTGSEFTEVLATSFDGSEITYAIQDGNGDGIFYINPVTGAVSLVSTLDYDTQRTHGLKIRAMDRANRQSSVLLLIQVLDVNDQVPITPPSALLQVTQSTPVGFPVGTLQCTDGDSSPNATMFNFTFIPASELFSVDSYGVVQLEGMLDDTPVYVLPVTCYDPSMRAAESTGQVTIDVNFINQNTPEFDLTRYFFSVREDVGVHSLVGTVRATDRDAGSYGEVTYAITSGNPDTFYVESEAGSIRLLMPLDRENAGSYFLTVEAIDGGLSAPDSARTTGTTMVLVMVEDANDNAPTLNQPSYVQTIATNHTVRTPVLSVNCTDHDQGGRSGVTYSLYPDTEQFVIQANGTILLAKEQTDQAVYDLHVVCNDVGIPTLFSSALVTIIVEDEIPSQYAPTFDEDHYTFTVSENQIVLSTIGQVHASINSNSQINVVYGIESGNSRGHFYIASTVGNITLTNPLNATEQQQYIVTIRASDALLNSSFSFASVSIRVVPVNSHPPVFVTQFYTTSIREATALFAPVTQVQCSDPDTNTHVSYDIGGFGAQVFNITQNGLIWVAGEINYETQILYTLHITCSDDGDIPLTAIATVRIDVLPANEFVPEFTWPVYGFNVPENSFGTHVGRVVATDSDAGSQGEVTYLLQDPGNFSVVIVEPSTGDVLVANNLDYETQHFWNLSVIARDGAGAESYATLQINVSNMNDVAPVITPSTIITTLSFDSPPGYPIQTYSCTDEDGSNAAISILNGNSLGYFELNAFDQLVWAGTAGDLSTDIVISLIVQCQDRSALEQVSLAHIVITVRGRRNTTSPQFSQEIYSTSIPENTPLDTSVLTVSASTDDASSSITTYELVNVPNNFPFGIHVSSGVINTIRSLNYEITSNYVFTVRANDARLGTSGVALVNVTIEDSNDNPPRVFPLLHTVTLPEDFPLTSIATFACIDNDSGRSGAINFMLELPSGNGSAPFNISNSGTVELAHPLDFEITERYNITVVCSDMGDSPLSAVAVLLVMVIGVNEFPPQFESDAYNFAVYENASAGDLVGILSATDRDAGMDGEIRYAITSGNGSAYFSVNSMGEVHTLATITSQPLNATQQRSLQLYVRVTDPGTLSDSTLVTIVILDVNEAPFFSEEGSYFAVTTTEQPANSYILNLTCFDTDIGDNAILNLEITGNPTNLDIFLHSDGSEGAVVASIVTNSTLSAGSYQLSLSCSDTGNPPLHTNATVTIRVEGPPVLSPPVTVSVPEDTHLNTLLVNVNATQHEAGNDVTYEITAGNELRHFRIENTNGNIYLSLPLDYEADTEHRIEVTASVRATSTILSSSTQITFLVENVNDVQPRIVPSGSQSITLLENEDPPRNIFSYTCMDQETNVTFSLSGSSTFAIQQTDGTGVVQLVDAVDYDQQNRYVLNIMCSDMMIGNRNTQYHISSVLVIQVTPVNIYAPVFTTASAVKVLENAGIGDMIAGVKAVDLDGRGQITYSSRSHTDLFLVDSVSGNVTLIGQLDYETQNAFSLVVVASDNDNEQGVVTPRTNMTSLAITVTDVNDNRPTCNSGLVTASLLNGTYSYEFLHELPCSDRDEGENSLLAYSFVGGTPPSIPGGTFLLNSTTGELGFTGTITAADNLVIHIIVSDSGVVPLSTRVTIIIHVTPSNVHPTQFEPDVFNVTISEDAPGLTTVLNGTVLQSALSNPLGATVSYVLHANPRYGSTFIIDPTSGDVVLSPRNLLDFDEGLREYILVVEATVGGDTATAVVDVVVTDVNDNHPTCTIGLTSASLPTGTYIYMLLVQLPCSDRDEGENSRLTYSFVGGTPPSIPGGTFLLNSITGELGFRGTITTANNLVIHIIVSDSGVVPLSTRVTIIIQVTPSNVNPPQFEPDVFNVTISEDAPDLTTVLNGSVLQSALSNPLGATVSYVLHADPNNGSIFIIDPTSGDVVLSSRNLLDFDEGLREYILVVEATVGGDTATAVVDINVTDYNDNAPRFEHAMYEGTVIEDQPLGTSVLTVIACDIDSGTNGEYYFSLEDTSDFSVNSTSGEITTTVILDRETHPTYSFVVVATDFGTPRQTGSTLVTIAIEDENDTPPQFAEPHYILSITTVLPPGTPLLTLEVTDLDITGNISFQITTSDRTIQDIFEIGSRDGILKLRAAIPNDNHAFQYNFTVEVNDSVSTDTTTVVVYVQSAPSATIAVQISTTPIPTSVATTTMEEPYTTSSVSVTPPSIAPVPTTASPLLPMPLF